MANKNIYCHDVIDAARDLGEWTPFVAPWARKSIVRALSTVVEYRKANPDSDRDDTAPLPPYAVKEFSAAVKHLAGVNRRLDYQEQTVTKPSGKFA